MPVAKRTSGFAVAGHNHAGGRANPMSVVPGVQTATLVPDRPGAGGALCPDFERASNVGA